MSKNDIKVTLTKTRGLAAQYKITQIQNAVVVEVPAAGKLDEVRVGDYLDEALAKRIAACVGVEVTVKAPARI